MTTQAWATRLRHDSDAEFRIWGLEFNAKLAAIGLIQTADTGQINWTTVVRPGTAATDAGFEIWAFPDALQATAPIYLKIAYGNVNGLNSPRVRIQVGTGTNGAGTLTGVTTALNLIHQQNGNSFTSNNSSQSYFCFKDGQLALGWKIPEATPAITTGIAGFFCLSRTVDSNGQPTATGVHVFWGAGTSSSQTASQSLRFASPSQAFTEQSATINCMYGFLAQVQLNTSVGSDTQVALGFTWMPRMQPLISPCGVLSTELTAGTTFNATLVGTTPRTYLRMPQHTGPFGPIGVASTGGLAMCVLWE